MRAFAFLALSLLLGAFIVLFAFPSDTERLFAWTIRPTMTAMLMGAGYLAAAYFFFRLLRERQWHRVALGFPAIVTFSACMTVATALHWDRFNHDHPAFWIWSVGYAGAPVVVLALWLVNRRADPVVSELGDVAVPSAPRRVLAVAGIGAIAISLLLIIQPSVMIAIWPWQLTPLTARVIGGWFAVPGVAALAVAFDGRWSAARILVQSQIAGIVLVVVAVMRAWVEFDQGTGTWAFIVGLIALLALNVGLYWRMELRSRFPG